MQCCHNDNHFVLWVHQQCCMGSWLEAGCSRLLECMAQPLLLLSAWALQGHSRDR